MSIFSTVVVAYYMLERKTAVVCTFDVTYMQWRCTWADPESFVRGGSKFDKKEIFSWWGDRGSKNRYKWAIIGLPAKHHWYGLSMVGRWWPNIECWLGSFVIFQEGVGSGPPAAPPPPLDPPMLHVEWIWDHQLCAFLLNHFDYLMRCESCNTEVVTLLANNIGPVKQKKLRKSVVIFLPISLNICCGCSKEPSH